MSSAKRTGFIAVAILLVVFGFILGTAVLPSLAGAGEAHLQVAQTNNQLITDDEIIFSDIYNRVSPSVVSINISQRLGGANNFEPLALGTGFVIDQQGHIVTNNHVVEGADRIEVNFYDGTIVRADIVGLDPDSDLAVIRVDLPPERLFPVTFADSDALLVGQRALAIGSPFGERWTLTSGIISALNRTIDGLSGYAIGAVIQTDAAINPGNSGGPLLNLQGQVIGVNSQIVSETHSNSGVGYAVPSNLVVRVARELIERGEVNYSYLGITGRDINLDLIEEYNLPNNLRGVYIAQIIANSPAENSELNPISNGSVDVITAVDGVPVYGFNTLIAYLATHTTPGQTVNLTVMRDGQQFNLPVVLGQRP